MTARTRAAWLAVVALGAALLTGCWDRVEIEDRATILAIGLDPGANPGELTLTAQIGIPGRIPLGPTGGGGSSQGPRQTVFVTSKTATSVANALDAMQNTLNAQIFLGHLRIIVMNEELARQSVDPFMDYFRRNPQVRRSSWLLVSRNPAAQVVEISPSFSRVPALFLSDMLEHDVNMGRLPQMYLGRYWSTSATDGHAPVLPYIEAEGDRAELLGMAVLPGQRMVDVVSMKELPTYLETIGGRKGNEIISVGMPGFPGETIQVQVIDRQSHLAPSLRDGKPHIDISIRMEANVIQTESPHKLNRPDQLATADREANLAVERSVRALIEKTQADGADIFGFGEQFRGELPAYWRSLTASGDDPQAAWRKEYRKMTFTVRVDLRIRRVGMENR